jgi:hypothetical protein
MGASYRLATRFLLLNCAETYVELTEDDQEEFDMLRDRKGYPRLEDIKMTWADRMKAQIWAEAKAEAKAQARVEESLRFLSRQIESRFGTSPRPAGESSKRSSPAIVPRTWPSASWMPAPWKSWASPEGPRPPAI